MANKPFFSQRLAILRKERNLSQYKLAEILGYSRGQIGNYEQGTREPDHSTLERFSEFFNVSVDYLLGNTEIREKSDEILNSKSVETKLTDEELRILELFRQLNEKEKIKIEGMLEMKVSEAKDLKRGMSSNYQNGEEAATLVKDLA